MSEVTAHKPRPKYLALNEIRQPLPAIVSILHRISGVGIFLMLPFLLYLLDRSLGSPETFETFAAVVDNWFIKLVLFGLLWAYLHHFCAGIRFRGGRLARGRRATRGGALVDHDRLLVARLRGGELTQRPGGGGDGPERD